jgi:hypothetical protein
VTRKLVENIKEDPLKTYPVGPLEVLRDRRLSDKERLEILEAWEKRLLAAQPMSTIDESFFVDVLCARRAVLEDKNKKKK